MIETFQSLAPVLKLYWYIAIPVSVIFIIQTIMTFVGADSFDGVEANFDGDLETGDTPFQLFSFRNLINFLLGFSWAGISFFKEISDTTVLMLVATAIGVVFIFMFFFIIRSLQKLAENNSFDISNTVDKTAEVYLTVPANKTGKGKILVSVNGAVHELEAITEKEMAINSGAMVKVVKIENENIVVVETI